MQTALNSVYYAMDLHKNLTQKGIIKGGFLRSTKLQKVDFAMFDRSLDLRGDPVITAAAADFQLNRIKSVTIYPSYLKPDTDFKVEFDEAGSERDHHHPRRQEIQERKNRHRHRVTGAAPSAPGTPSDFSGRHLKKA